MCSAALQLLHPWFPCKPQFRLQNERPYSSYTGKNPKASSFFSRHSHGRISLNRKRHSPKLLEQLDRYDSSNPNRNLSGKCSISGGAAAEDAPREDEELQSQKGQGFWRKWKANSAEMSAKLAKLGLAAVLGYGLFDGVTYTSFFVLAFLGYEKSTGNNPAANLQALLGIVILMWTGNNVTRPFRVAGAAALAPVIDKGLKKIQRYFNFPNTVYAFALVAAMIGSVCGTVVGLLILSRWRR